MAKYRIGGDIGHGGNDPGAVNGSRKESADVCKLGIEVMNYVEKQTNNEILMYLNRTNEKTLSLKQRSDWANKEKFKILIAFHRDSSPNKKACGATVRVQEGYINKDAGKLAKCITKRLKPINPGDRADEDRVIEQNLHITRETNMPSVLIECGFISNDNDNKIFDSKFNEIVAAIGDGIIEYLGVKKIQPKQTKYRVKCYGMTSESRAKEAVEILKKYGSFNASYEAYQD